MRKRRGWPGLGAVLLTLALPGCLFDPSDDELERNRRRWQSQGIDDYEVGFRNVCFCGPDSTAPVRLRVQDGRLVAVTREADGRPVDPSQWEGRYLTVDQVFAFIEDAQRQNAHEVRVAYDPALGHPTDVFVDQSEQIADEERGLELRALLPLR